MTWAAVGTAIAVGAGVGAGSQLIQGKGIDDALRGALIGGATGALTGGAGAALGGASGSAGATLSTEAASQIAPELVNTAAVNAIPLETVIQEAVPTVASAGIDQITPEMMNAINQGATDAFAAQGTGTQVAGPAMNVAPTPLPVAGAPPAPSATSNFGIKGVGPDPSAVSPFDTGVKPMIQGGDARYASTMGQLQPNVMAPIAPSGPVAPTTPSSNPFMEGFASVKEFVKKNPLETAVIGYAGLSALDSFDSSEDPRKKRTYVNKYPISANYQPSRPVPNVYRPSYAGYAEGGITSFDDEAGVDQFVRGGSAREKRDPDADFKRYSSMMNARPEVEADEEPLRKPRFARDDDADTRYQDALTAALIRQKKNNARANIGSPSIKRPTPLGTINLAPPGTQQAAAGGIMGYSLGGYAAGGNPRLLKGPGDGMSDDIPAVIGRKQPARLADGEFVVPADVVSHLGNGSTDAGAKKLHQMMDRIRTDRTGRKKQAPEVNADKYLPGKKKAAGGIASIAGYAEGGITGYDEGGGIRAADDPSNPRNSGSGGTTYSDAQVTQAIAQSVADGFSVADSVQAATTKYGISPAQANKAASIVNAYQTGLGRPPDQAGAAYWANSGLSGAEIAAAIAASPEAKTTRTATSPNTSGGVYDDKTFSPAQIASYMVGNNIKTPAEISRVQNLFGLTSADMSKAQDLIARNDPSITTANTNYANAIAANPSAVAENRNAIVNQIFTQQLGRAPDAAGLQYWSNLLANGASEQSIAAGIAQSKEGQDMDLQAATSAYRQALGRNPEPGGMQYWFSVAQNEGLSSKQLQDRITAAANAELTVRNIAPGTKFTQMELDALGANPYAGYYSEKSIYDIAPDAKNVSMIGNRQVQFTTPVTQQAVISQFIDGVYTAKQGLDMLNTPQAMASLNVALANGALDVKDYDNLVKELDSSKTPAEVRAALSKPKAQVVIDAAYGQQIGEAANLAEAQREAALRQSVLTGLNPEYYLSNRTLTDAYQKAGVSTPFQYDFYKGVDTRDRESVMVTPENFLDKKNELVNATRANPYRVLYDPLNPNNPNNLTPANRFATRDPYSDEGLKLLYGQMMDQYGTQPTTRVNPATVATTPYTYKPPVPQRIQDERNAKAAYDAKVAADKLAYEKAALSAENFDEADYIRRNPDAFQDAPGRPYQHYLEANRAGDVRIGNKRPFTPTPFTQAPIITNAAAPAPTDTATGYYTAPSGQVYGSKAAYDAANASTGGGKAGGIAKGIASIKHRKRRA